MSEDVAFAQDAWSEDSLRISQFIMSCRIYDVLMALLKEANSDVARDVLEMHAGGIVLGPQPSFNGIFLTDEMNAQTGEETNE